jgi:di/tricarboxylate transporter
MRSRQALSPNERSSHEPCFKRLADGRHGCGLRFDLCGVALGRAPGLRIDRAGIALVFASLMIGLGSLSLSEALKAIDLDAIALLLDMMIIVSQLRVSDFYDLGP